MKDDIDPNVISMATFSKEERLKYLLEAQNWLMYRYSGKWFENVILSLIQEIQENKENS